MSRIAEQNSREKKSRKLLGRKEKEKWKKFENRKSQKNIQERDDKKEK